jgi:D-alanyl-D-alanine carboxypeptidase
MGWVRFGGRVGLLFLGLAAVAPLAITSDAADGRRHRDVHVQNVHHSGLVHYRAHATSPAAAPAAVRTAAQLEEAQSTIIVVAPEPGAVVTSTKPVPTMAEPAKPEPVAGRAIQQPHAPTGWLIQIGAFDSEAEARQHLSEAQRQASTVLAAADPFTEGVQRGDKLLSRARFAGFDKESAEIACKQLKRGHFECMALKD